MSKNWIVSVPDSLSLDDVARDLNACMTLRNIRVCIVATEEKPSPPSGCFVTQDCPVYPATTADAGGDDGKRDT